MARLVDIGVDSKWRWLGNFDAMSDALEVRAKAELDLGYHKNHGRLA